MSIHSVLKPIALGFLITVGGLNVALAADLELESKSPGQLVGTLQYASMKFWVEIPGKESMALWPKEKDEQALMEMIGKQVSLDGSVLIYSNGSRYFEPKLTTSTPATLNFSLKKTDDLVYEIYLNDKMISSTDSYQYLEIEYQFDIPGGKVALLALGSGGVACPALYQVLVAQTNTPVMTSEVFGTCSDSGQLSKLKDGFTLSLPGNPAETWRWEPALKTVVKQ